MDAPEQPKRIRRRRIDDTVDRNDYLKVRFIENKVYASGHIERNTGVRVFERGPDNTSHDILFMSTCCPYLSAPVFDELETDGWAFDLYDERIHPNKLPLLPGLVFHQMVLIKE